MALVILLNIPAIQQRVTVFISTELSALLKTKVTIEEVNIGLLNRIIIDKLVVEDQTGNELLNVSRLSAKFSIRALIQNRVAINSVQLFGFIISLNKANEEADTNFKFILDALKSKNPSKPSTLNLRINSILMRRGKMSYDILSAPNREQQFTPKHIRLTNILANISLKAFTPDSINAHVKRLSFEEQSGFELTKLTLHLRANQKQMWIDEFKIALPNSQININTFTATYPSFDSFKDFNNQILFNTRLSSAKITPSDLKSFVPSFKRFEESITLNTSVTGTLNSLACKSLKITSGNKLNIEASLETHNLVDPVETYLFGNVSHLSLTTAGIEMFVRNFSANYTGVPTILSGINTFDFNGEISGYLSELVTYGVIKSNLGSIRTDVKLTTQENGTLNYSGSINTDKFKLHELLAPTNKFGEVSFKLFVNGDKRKGQTPSMNLKGVVSSFHYNAYNYENITLDGNYNHDGFNGKVELNDDNGLIHLDGNIDLTKQLPLFNFHASLSHVRPFELALSKQVKPGTDLSMEIQANFEGNSIDDMIGEINIDNVNYIQPEDTFEMKNLRIAVLQEDESKLIKLTSPYIDATIRGDYSYKTLPASVLNVIERYIPSVLSLKKETTPPSNNFEFQIHLRNTEELTKAFNLPLTMLGDATLSGLFNDNQQQLNIEGHFPEFKVGNLFFRSGVLLGRGVDETFNCLLKTTNIGKKGNTTSLTLSLTAKDNQLKTSLYWGNSSAATFSGEISLLTAFTKATTPKSTLEAQITVLPTQVIVNDTIWEIRKTHIDVDQSGTTVHNFLFEHQDRYLKIDGKASKEPTDTLKVNLNQIDVNYVMDVTGLRSINFGGLASGPVYVSQAYQNPILNTKLSVKNFSFNEGYLGDLEVYGAWDNEKKGIYLSGVVTEKELSKTTVKGYIYPVGNGLDLHIVGQNTPAKPIEFFLKSIFSNLDGRLSGEVRLYGKFAQLNLEGAGMIRSGVKINLLNTTYQVQDSIYLTPKEIIVKNLRVRDANNNVGVVNGSVKHKNFKDMDYRFQIQASNLLCFNMEEQTDFPFYGTVYGTGNATIRGNNNLLTIDVNMRSNPNSDFTYATNSVMAPKNSPFIHYVGGKETLKSSEEMLKGIRRLHFFKPIIASVEKNLNVKINLQLEVTPDVKMKMLLSDSSGDNISGKGAGNIRLEYDNKGDIKMFGNYTIEQGVYKFSLQEVIRKDFNLKNGSMVTFNGNPMNAILDIKASHTVNSVSLKDLGDNILTQSGRSDVKLNCLMNITGIMTSPTIGFDIELPNESEDTQQRVRYYISSEDQMNMQILYLLGIGKFYTPDYANGSQGGNKASSVISSTLSGQLNSVFSQIIDNNNWNIGANISTGEKGWSAVEMEGVLSGQLLNNRLLINGNFGYRENTTSTNTTLVGDFDVEYLLTNSGEIRFKAYNRTNDNRYSTTSSFTTQGVGMIFKKEFTSWNEFQWFRKKKELVAPKDSVLLK